LAFHNNLDGFTDNFNTGILTVTNCTSVDNARYNYIFRLNPYASGSEQSVFTNNISFRSTYDSDSVADYISGSIQNSYFFGSENDTVTANDFISVTTPASYERNTDGTISYGDYMHPTLTSFLATSGVGTAHIGAIPPVSTEHDVLVSLVAFDKASAALNAGESLALNATVAPENATNQALDYTSSNPGVASVDSNGTVSALSKGRTIIKATSTGGSNITATCVITVEASINPDVLVTSITFDKTSATLNVGENLTLNAAVAPENATNKSLTFTSSKPSVASVDSNGSVLALAEGTTTISATSKDGSNITTNCTVTVNANTILVTSVTLSKNTLVLAKGTKETLTAKIAPENATNASIVWSSSNEKVASVDANGKISGKAYGSAIITATSAENSSMTATCKVSVGYKINYKLNKGKNHANNPSAYYKQKISLKSPTRKGYVFKGWYTDSKFKTKITSIKKNSSKNYTLYAKWEKVKKPSNPTLKSVTNTKNLKMKVALKSSVSNAKGYEITYATNKKFTKNKDTATISKATTLTKTISKLTKGKTYYVKVRAYTTDSAGNKVYGKYSNTISIKIKK